MKSLRQTTIGAMAILALASCRSFAPDRIEGEWVATTLGDRQVTDSTAAPYIGFEGTRLYGHTGCNRLTTTLSPEALKKGILDHPEIATTMMACPDAPYETAFMEALTRAARIQAKGDRMQLADKDGRVVMKLVRRRLTAEWLEGEWDVVELQGRPVPQEDDDVPFLGFDTKQGRLYGFTGCNRMTGTLHVEDMLSGKADFSRTGTTRMLCADDRYESVFLAALSDARTVTSQDGFLVLRDGSGKTVVRLARSNRK